MSAPILIVDDNLSNQKLARVLLESEGYEVLTANDASAALALLEGQSVRAILMDIQLPGISGLELTRILKKTERLRDIPVIAVTAYAMSGDEEVALSAGCDAYITKPIDFDNLIATLRSLLARSGR